MKKILLTLCVGLLTFAIHAQEHMIFKDVSMGCNITTFVSQLKAKGFTVEEEADYGVTLKGDFAGKRNCFVFVFPTKQSKMVWKVAVKFPDHSSWDSIKSEYLTFKDSYTKKYGKPESHEFFSSPFEEGNGYEMTAIMVEKCTYVSYFRTNMGLITLQICNNVSQKQNSCVLVNYEDFINFAIYSKEVEAIVQQDI